MKKHLVATAAVVTGMLASAPAAAAQFIWSAGVLPVDFTVSGTVITSDTANANGSFDVLSIIGTFSNAGVTGNVTGPVGYAAADNVIFTSQPYLSTSGVSVLTSFSGRLNFRYVDGAYTIIDALGESFALTYFNLAPRDPGPGPGTGGAIPEPQVWALLLLGFGTLGSVLRRRRRHPRVSYTAA